MHAIRDFQTKEELREAVAAYLAGGGDPVLYYKRPEHPYPLAHTVYVIGPHHPEPDASHTSWNTWYAECKTVNGIIMEVK